MYRALALATVFTVGIAAAAAVPWRSFDTNGDGTASILVE